MLLWITGDGCIPPPPPVAILHCSSKSVTLEDNRRVWVKRRNIKKQRKSSSS